MNDANLNDLVTFHEVALSGSFAGAARALKIPKSTVKRRIDRLEDALGASLVVRSGRRAALTEKGAALARYTAEPLRALTDLNPALDASQPSGTLRIAASPDLGASAWFVDLLAGYRAAYPQVKLDVDLATRFVDLNEERIDIAIRPVTPATSPNLRMRKIRLGGSGALYASPDYIDARGRPRQPQQLTGHDGVILKPLVNGFRLHRGDDKSSAHPEWTTLGSDYNFITRAIVAGLGIGPLPAFVAKPLVDSGKLCRVLTSWTLPPVQVAVVWSARRIESPRVRAFIDRVPLEVEVPL